MSCYLMDGYQFLEEKNKDPGISLIPVIVVSATADLKLLNGVAGVIKKPFVIDHLLEAIERCCQI